MVGLGNPGKNFEHTRHNFGARVVQAFVESTGRERLAELGVAYLLPTVNMNDSGRPIAEFLWQTPLEFSDILLVHDELELPLGEWKFQSSGGARGHNGVRSVQAALGTQEIPRLRLGISRPTSEAEVSDYVLQNFTAEEEKIVEKILGEAVAALKEFYSPDKIASAS